MEGDFRVCGGILVELEKNRDLEIGHDHGSQPESQLHYQYSIEFMRSNQATQIFIGKQIFNQFKFVINSSLTSKIHYMTT